jgi:hypothetical protein
VIGQQYTAEVTASAGRPVRHGHVVDRRGAGVRCDRPGSARRGVRVRPRAAPPQERGGLRGDTSIEDRARFDKYYIENCSLWNDLKIILRTVAAVLRRSGG